MADLEPPVTGINRQKIIEAAATAIHDAACTFHSDIVAAALKPIRELHREQFQFCRECDADYPCLTVRLLDQIETDSKGGE